MLAEQEVKRREDAQDYPLVAEVTYTRQIVQVLAFHGEMAWCIVRPSNKYINVLEKDLRYLEPSRK